LGKEDLMGVGGPAQRYQAPFRQRGEAQVTPLLKNLLKKPPFIISARARMSRGREFSVLVEPS
jgi:hypothetical protein